jgi:A/G-specific adenine glycosylase
VFLRQRPATAAQLAGMWELPELAAAPARAPLLTLRHAITTSDITAHVYAAKPAGRGVWMSATDLDTLPLTGLARKILRRLAKDL